MKRGVKYTMRAELFLGKGDQGNGWETSCEISPKLRKLDFHAAVSGPPLGTV